MSSVEPADPGLPTDTRQRLIDVGMALVSRHGFGGTSLQMIADELGFTKAAIYYHFRTRDHLLIALMEPMLHDIRRFVELAEAQRTARTQADAMIVGFASVVAKNRALAAVMVFDPDVHRILQLQPDWGDLIIRQLTLLTQLDPEETGIIKATALMTGLAGAATGAPTNIDEQALVDELSEIGRRMMGLRAPKRQDKASVAPRPKSVAGRWNDFLAEG